VYVEDIQGNDAILDKRRTTYINGIKEATSKTNKTLKLFRLVTEQETNKSGIRHSSSSEAASASGQRNNAQPTQKNSAKPYTSNKARPLGYITLQQTANQQTNCWTLTMTQGSVETRWV
jgi:hypothetical protein